VLHKNRVELFGNYQCWPEVMDHLPIRTFIFFSHGSRALVGSGLLCEVPRSHSDTTHIRYDSSGRVISPSQRPLPDNIQQSQQTDIYEV